MKAKPNNKIKLHSNIQKKIKLVDDFLLNGYDLKEALEMAKKEFEKS